MLLSITLLSMLTGCLQIKTVINVKADGSGEVEQTFLMRSDLIEMMKGFQTMGEDNGDEESDLFTEEELEENAGTFGRGVHFVSAESLTTEWGEGYRAVYRFNDISQLKINQNPGEKMPSDAAMMDGGGEDPAEYVRFDFKKGNPAVLTVYIPQEEDVSAQSEESGDLPEEGFGDDNFMDPAMLAEFYADMRVRMMLHFPGGIVSTNAQHRDGPRVTLLDIDFSKIMSNPEVLEELMSGNTGSITAIRDTIDTVPGIAVETAKEIVVKFR